MKAALLKQDAVMEPELRELCGELDAIHRAKTAEKFMRWADQLTESAMLMEPQLVVMLPPPKVPRGFMLVNVAKWKKDELRRLARESGCALRSLIGWAITHTGIEMKERLRIARMLGVAPHECWKFIGGNAKN